MVYLRVHITHLCLLRQLLGHSLFRSPVMWVKLDVYYILGEECQLFKFIRKFRYLGMEDLA